MNFRDEKIIETKSCENCDLCFDITDKDIEFYKKVSPIFLNKKYSIPTPKLCPICRENRRLSFRNERRLYKRICDATGKNIISMYNPDKVFPVYNQDYWWSDSWDGMDYGTDFNFTRLFFEQFQELLLQVPKMNLSVETQENCDFTNYAGRNKDCYLIFLGAENNKSFYCNAVWNSTQAFDCIYSRYLENCWNVIDSRNCYECFFSQFLIDCQNCIFCHDLKNKKYHIFNTPVSKQDFQDFQKKLGNNKTLTSYIEKFNNTYYNDDTKVFSNFGSENVSGEYILNSSNIKNGYDISNVSDSKYVSLLWDVKESYDFHDWGHPAELCYECHKVGDTASNIKFSVFCLSNVSNLLYCYDCVNGSNNLFGCVGLKNKSYCIFNKQYSKENYNKIVPQIIEHMKNTGEWGEFFPSSLSLFGYNETVAYENTPLNEIQAQKNKYNWSNYESPAPKVDKIILANTLPENIVDIPDDILNWAIECEVSKKPFKILPQELDFHRKYNIPIPRKHPDIRNLEKMKLRNPKNKF